MTPPLTVEFIGVCASGKSTTARRLINDLREDGKRCPTEADIVRIKGLVGLGYSFGGEPYQASFARSHRWYWLFREAFKNPLGAIGIIWFAAPILPHLMFCGGAGRSVFKEALLLRLGEIGAFDVVIWDEAVIHQVLASELEPMVGLSRLLKILGRIYRRLNVVFVLHKIDSQLAVSRFQDQPSRFLLDHRFTNKQDYYRAAEQDLSGHNSLLDVLVREEFCADRVLVLDATASVERKSAVVQEFIAKMRSADKAR